MVEPSKFYRQHVAVEAPEVSAHAFRQAWRVRTKLDQLLLDRAITPHQWRAAIRFRTLADIVTAGAVRTQSLEATDPHPIDTSTALARRKDASDRLIDIRSKIGWLGFQLLELHVVEDRDWKDIARRYRVHPTTARRWTVVALQALAGLPL